MRMLSKLAVTLGACSFSIFPVFADESDFKTQHNTAWLPRVIFEAQSGTETTGEVDALIPFIDRYNALFFGDIRGYASSEEIYEGNFGLGYRQIMGNDAFILGGYVFYDYSRSNNRNTFSQITVGGEILGHVWDFRANGYIPVGRRKILLTSGFENPQLTGHKIILDRFGIFEEAQPGFDVEVGRVLSGNWTRALRGYLGYYHFGFGSGDTINGGRIRLEQEINQYIKLTASVQYDSVRKTHALAGVRIRFGGVNQEIGVKAPRFRDLRTRMMDKIIRDPEIVTQTRREIIGSFTSPENFFYVDNRVGGFADGTFENPFPNVPEAVTAANNGDTVYIFRGNGNDYNLGGNLTFKPQQIIHGSGSDLIYTPPGSQQSFTVIRATGRPVLRGQLTVATGNTLKSFSLLNNGSAAATGVTINNASNVTLYDMNIGGFNNQDGFTTGVAMRNSSAEISYSTINAYFAGNNAGVSAIFQSAIGTMDINNTLSVHNSTLNATAIGNDNIVRTVYQFMNISGAANSANTIHIYNTSISASAHGDTSFASGITQQLNHSSTFGGATGTNNLSLKNSHINSNSSGANSFSDGVRQTVFSVNAAATFINDAYINNSYITVNNSGGIGALGFAQSISTSLLTPLQASILNKANIHATHINLGTIDSTGISQSSSINGLALPSSNTLEFKASVLSIESIADDTFATGFSSNVFGAGVGANNTHTATIQDSQITVDAIAPNNDATAQGIFMRSNTNFTVINNFFNITAVAPNGTATALGINNIGGNLINQNNIFNLSPP